MIMMNDADRILRDLASLRKRIERMEGTRSELYAAQKVLYLQGEKAGLIATEMARAMRPNGEIEHLAESVRQVLRENKNGPKKVVKKVTKKKVGT